MRNEIDMVLAQIGCAAFSTLDARYLWNDGREAPVPLSEPEAIAPGIGILKRVEYDTRG